jgi:hypothetical protein
MIGAIRWREFRGKYIKHCKITWTLDLATESLVELSWTLDLVQQKALSYSTRRWTWYNGNALSSSTRRWTWYNGKPCRAKLDIGPGTMESLVELNSTFYLVQWKALSNSTRHWTWYNGKPCRTQDDIGPGATENLVELNSTLDCNRPAHLIHTIVFALNLFYRTKMVECCEISKEELRR